jgi:hypothetical protein
MFSRHVRIYDGLYDLFGREGWGRPHAGVTMANMCPYGLDELFFDLLRVRSVGFRRGEVDARLGEFRTGWDRRIGALARSKLTGAQHERYLALIALTAMAGPIGARRSKSYAGAPGKSMEERGAE